MLFAALLKVRSGTNRERTVRRVEWDYPEGGAQVVAEYWLQADDPAVIVICEADHIGQLWLTFQGWDDVFELSVFPAVSAEDGLEMARQIVQE